MSSFSIESKADKISIIEISDMNGKTLLSRNLNDYKVSLAPSLMSGIYLIKVTLTNGKFDIHHLVISK